MSPALRVTRRRVAAGLLGLVGLGCMGRVPASQAAADFFLTLQPLMRKGRKAIAARKWVVAIGALERALQLVEVDPDVRWPFRAYVLPAYGLALLELGRVVDAIAQLSLAMETERRIEGEVVDVRFKQVLASLASSHSRMLLGVEFRRQFMDAVEFPGRAPPHALEGLLFDDGASALASTTLARALARAGRRAELMCLYQSERVKLPILDGSQSPEDLPAVSAEYRLFTFGVLLASVGNWELANDAMARTLALSASRARQIGTWVPSVEAHLAVFSVRRYQLWAAIGIVLSMPTDAYRVRLLVANIVESKGLGVRHAERMRMLLARSFSPALRQACGALEALDDEMSHTMAGAGLMQAFLLRKAKESALLSEVMPALRNAGLASVFVDGESVIRQAAAVPAVAFIGFLAYRRLRPDASGFDERRYARYVVAGEITEIQDIGGKREIDERVQRWRHAALRRAALSEMTTLGSDLRQRLLGALPAPVLALERWVLDPDSDLCLLPFEALPGVRNSTLLQEHCISYVTSLASWCGPVAPASDGDARVVADPSYPAARASAGQGPERKLEGGASAGRRNLQVSPLPHTREEAAAVVAAMAELGVPVQLFLGRDASPQALTFDTAPRYLHVAAHGLMLSAVRDSDDGAHAAMSIVLPGRAAALALADGESVRLVHAYQLQRLPLQGTELVVLSACDTGNGALDAGEGVASLRRAVEVAGARASLTSLWPVPSAATAQLMKGFYRRLARGVPAAQALRAAKLDLMQHEPHALAWSGFLLAGR